MTPDEITRMAREAGFDDFFARDLALERFAALVAAAEREACARLVQGTWVSGRTIVVKAIRARGE